MQKIAFICTVFSENSNLHTTNTLYDKQLASEPRHLIEGGASRYTALAVPAPLEGGDFPSTAWSHLSSGNSLHRNKTDIGGQGACGPCGQPRNFCLERRRLRIRTRFQDLPYQEPCSYVV